MDVSKPPGTTRAQCPESLVDTLQPIVTGQAFLYSPNSSWFLLTCFVWWLAPYRLDRPDMDWQDHLRERLLVNHLLTFVYIGFWHISLYWWQWGKRPYAQNRVYFWGKILHNIFYTWLGVLQWTATEVAFINCYKEGQIPYQKKTLSVENPSLVLHTLLICILLPNFRDIHFYFSHRLMHAPFLYKYIHSVHHRNVDIEPFSGLCMHPLEHMLYYTCYAPCLFFCWHPLILFWMGVHVVISPAASHSGYEDHFSADLVHYLHHRYTDCNFGVPQSIPFDVWFGTYRGRLEVEDNEKSKLVSSEPKARLGIMPDYPIFNFTWMLLWWTVWFFWNNAFAGWPWTGAVLATLAPLVVAYVSYQCSSSRSTRRRSILVTFEKDPLWSQLLHFGVGLLMGVLPATSLVYLVLQQA